MRVVKRSSKVRLRRAGPVSFVDRLDSITTPLVRPESVPTLVSAVTTPGTSRYQRMSAHLPSGVTRFRGMGVVSAHVVIDLTSGEPRLDITA